MYAMRESNGLIFPIYFLLNRLLRFHTVIISVWGHQCKGSRRNREDMTRIDRLDRYFDDQEELRAIYYGSRVP
jgi:hypothetical protein